MPPFAALLSNPSLEVFSNHGPTLGAILVYQVNNLHKHLVSVQFVNQNIIFSVIFYFMDGEGP